MFDEEEEKLLTHSLFKIQQDFKNHSKCYEVSAFDEKFDEELSNLVIHYSFDF